ncbi:hypothetical protein B0H14DRAFT_3491756 [Mycena olivaceomarginata]|nr:hypothetical protein B0H14DRAFT_3491756 [Mycena olivaceomarginata]
MAYPPLKACALTTSVRPPHQMRPDPKTLGILDVPERFYKRFGPPSLNACTPSTSATPPHRISLRHETIGIKDVLERVYRYLGPPAIKRVYAAHVGADSPPDHYPTFSVIIRPNPSV